MQRDFVQGEGLLEKKPHSMRWVITCKENRNRGLGIKILQFSISIAR